MSTFVRTLFPARTRLGGFLAGLGAMASVWPPAPVAYRYPHRSDLEALKGDAERVGADMHRVIDREYALIEARKK